MGMKYILSNPSFLEMLKTFDLNTVSKKTLEKLKTQFFNKSGLTIEKLKNISSIAPGLFLWIKSIYDCCVFKEK